jgi:hypothetical protein
MCESRLSANLSVMYTGNLLIDAQSAFARERRGARRERVVRWLTRRPRACSRLLSLDHALAGAPPATRSALGLHAIALDSIVGTTEQAKVDTFDRRFRPPSISRGRWQRLWMAARRGSPLPPISVMRVGEQHFVVDGHHRVSVAHSLGMSAIDAEVTLLRAQTCV